MAWLVFVLGCALSLTGAAAITLGAAIIDVDRGSIQVIAGTIALSCGIVTIALGCILIRIESVRVMLSAEFAGRAKQSESVVPRVFPDWAEPPRPREDMSAPVVPPEPLIAAAAIPAGPVALAAVREPAPVEPEQPVHSPVPAEEIVYPAPEPQAWADPAPVVNHEAAAEPFEITSKHEPEPAPVEHLIVAAEHDVFPTDALPLWHEPPIEPSRAVEPAEAGHLAMGAPGAVAEAHDPGPPPTEHTPAETEPPAVETPDPELSIVGRYNAGGVSYIMFSDGSIEATRGSERFTFQSITELKAFIEGGAPVAAVV